MQTLVHDLISSESEEDYINMEVQDSSFSAMFNTEFEFSISSEKDQHAMTSPADELFYMGTLLPLHLPPRLDMVQKILLQQNNFDTKPQLPEESCHECSVSLYTKEKKPWAKKLMKWANLKSLLPESGGCARNDDPTPKQSSSIKPFGQIKYNKVSSFEKDHEWRSFKMESESTAELENPIQAAIAHCKRVPSLDQ